MAQQQTRGRGARNNQQRRGKSQPRVRDFGNPQTEAEEMAKIQDSENRKVLNREIAKTKKPKPGVSEVIERGKKFMSNIFNGFTSEDRSNIKVHLDDTFPTRVASTFASSIEEYISSERDLTPDDDQGIMYYRRFQGIMHIATAIKLHKSSPQNEKSNNHMLPVLNSNIRIPARCGTIIDQVGKTDLPNDNKIRIPAQNIAAKRHLIRGVALFYSKEKFAAKLEGGQQCADIIYDSIDKMELLTMMVDNKPQSLKLLKEYGRISFENLSRNNFSFKMNAKTYKFRLPSFNFKEEVTKQDVNDYLTNSVFTDFSWTEENTAKIIGTLVLQCAEMKWLRHTEKTMGELDSAFEASAIKNVVFGNILEVAGIWNINSYISDTELNEIASESIQDWNATHSAWLSKIINFTEFNFSEYGSDAQLIEMEKPGEQKENAFGQKTYRFARKNRAKTILKTEEHNAVLGIISGFVKKVEMHNNFEVNFNNNNESNLREYLKNDLVSKIT